MAHSEILPLTTDSSSSKFSAVCSPLETIRNLAIAELVLSVILVSLESVGKFRSTLHRAVNKTINQSKTSWFKTDT